MKSYVNDLDGLYAALLKDCAASYPEDRRDWELDLSSLQSILVTGDVEFFTITLPALGKAFDFSLSVGHLDVLGLPHCGRAKKSSPIPRLFRALWIRVFEDSGVLKGEPDITAIFLLRQLCYAAKKIKAECDDTVKRKTVRGFLETEASLRNPSLRWDEDDLIGSDDARLHLGDTQAVDNSPNLFSEHRVLLDGSDDGDSGLEEGIQGLLDYAQQCCDVLSSSFGPLEVADLRPKHGPGAVAERGGARMKYAFTNWPAKLQVVFPFDWHGLPAPDVATHMPDDGTGRFINHEPPSRLLAVPKTMKGPRLIAAEPTSHQWIQQGLSRKLEALVAKSPLRWSIDFHNQEANQRGALEASRTGLYATVDLSDASDRLSCWIVERFFRSNLDWLLAIHACRTRWCSIKGFGACDGSIVLRKFATQGSALTFPLQSIVFATLATACVLWDNGRPRVSRKTLSSGARQVTVFGDDILLPSSSLDTLRKLFAYVGLKVNDTKTFGTGRFRESCGVDAYAGYDVTPAYFRQGYNPDDITSVKSVVECSNNFHLKGLWYSAQWLTLTLGAELLSQLGVKDSLSDAFGLSSFAGESLGHLLERWNKDLHRSEVRVVEYFEKVPNYPQPGEWSLLQYFTEEPSPTTKWESGIRGLPTTRRRRRWVASTDFRRTPGKRSR